MSEFSKFNSFPMKSTVGNENYILSHDNHGLDEDILKLLIEKADNEGSAIIQKYTMECIHKFITTNIVSGSLSSLIVDFLIKSQDKSLQINVCENLIGLSKNNGIEADRFVEVFDRVLDLFESTTTQGVDLNFREGLDFRSKVLDCLNALFLRQDSDVSDILSAITDKEEENHSTAALLLNSFSSTHFHSTLLLFLALIDGGDMQKKYVHQYLNIVAILTCLAAQQFYLSSSTVTPLSSELLTSIFTSCKKQYNDSNASEIIMQTASLTMACLAMHKLPSILAENVMDFFVMLDRIDEVTGEDSAAQPILRTQLQRQMSKKRSNVDIIMSSSRASENNVSNVNGFHSSTSSHSHDDITSQVEYDHVIMSVAISLKGLSTLLLYGNVEGEERVNCAIEMILERTDLFERASLGYDTGMYGYMTSCAFVGVRRLFELGLLSQERINSQVLPLLMDGANYDKNVYGKSRSAARLALAVLVKCDQCPVDRRSQLLDILTAKKEKGFSDHNLRTTPKEKLVSVAIDLLLKNA